jgi:periplasmic divalent cation tolerance protein
MSTKMVYMTAGSLDEAKVIGKELVKSRTAACVNIIEGMQSIYRWEGRIEEDREVVVIAKTSQERLDELIHTVKGIHSYDCPCIVSIPIEGGNPAFLEWIQAEVGISPP